jgi:hypothetical protein
MRFTHDYKLPRPCPKTKSFNGQALTTESYLHAGIVRRLLGMSNRQYPQQRPHPNTHHHQEYGLHASMPHHHTIKSFGHYTIALLVSV